MLRALLAGLVLALFPGAPAAAETLQGHCVDVHDGDTVTVQIGGKREKIRLVGIDAPELAQAPWGKRARDFTAGLALDKDVRIETDVQPRDRYGRLLGYVYVGPTFVNLAVIEAGHAVLLTYPPNVAHVDAFTRAQAKARAAHAGIWDAKSPLTQTPYQFRHPGAKAAPRAAPRAASPRKTPAPAEVVRFNRRSHKIHTATCGHPCKTCEDVPMREAVAAGGALCKTR